LAQRRHQCGASIDYEGRISEQGDVSVREALCKAAASLLLRVRKMVCLARAWADDGQVVRHAVCDHRCGVQGQWYSASNVGQRSRLS
jgi:hypothetical protein